MRNCDQAVIQAFRGVLQSADPVQLLLAAERGGFGLDPSVGGRAAATAVATSLGYPLAEYRNSVQAVFVTVILGRLHDLNAAGYTTLRSLITDNPKGNSYSYSYI
jgi:hypothetical protein